MDKETIKSRHLYELAETVSDFLRENYSKNGTIEISSDYVKAVEREEKLIILASTRNKRDVKKNSQGKW